MGIESFRVELHSNSNDRAKIVAVVRSLEGCENDRGQQMMPNQLCFLVHRQGCVVEMEILPESNDISCRMTVCHPATADSLFSGLVIQLAEWLGVTEVFCPDGIERTDFAVIPKWACQRQIEHAIQRKRAAWQQVFGDVEGVLTSSEVFEQIIKPWMRSSANAV